MHQVINFKQLRITRSFKLLIGMIILVGAIASASFGGSFFSQISLVQPAFASATGTLSATANPCQIPVGAYQCNSTISWTSSAGAPNVYITIRENPGSLFATGSNGSQTATWITASGATFDLYSNSLLLATLRVTGNPPGTISASPNPCNLSGGACTSTINWSVAAGVPHITVRVREAGNALFSSGTPGSVNAPWIYSGGYHFDLYSDSTLIDSVFVYGH